MKNKADFEEIKETKKRGLIAGYEPNRISLYIMFLVAGRNDELLDLLYNDMEEHKIDGVTQEEVNGRIDGVI